MPLIRLPGPLQFSRMHAEVAYEKDGREGEKVAVPKPVRLACYTLTAGIADYHGPDTKQKAEKNGGDATRGVRQES
jgi:hypothetical protein